MSLSGRLVPWISWDEWEHVGRYLYDTNDSEVQKGLAIVSAWRIRGRVPVGVDATANLKEIQCADAKDDTKGSSEYLLRLQYSLSIVRFVNGVADSAQKGRMAVSIATLAQQVGIPRILVDIRHESTHNELPSLSTLRVAAVDALQWLQERYWRAQKSHIVQSRLKIQHVFDQYVESHISAAGKEESAVPLIQGEQGDVSDDDNKHDDVEYDVRKSKKMRQALLTDLRSRVPAGAEDLLLEAFKHSTRSESNIADTIGCRRAMKHISSEWNNVPSMLVQTYMCNLFESIKTPVVTNETICSVWFRAALDTLDSGILGNMLSEMTKQYATILYNTYMCIFIDSENEEELETNVTLLKAAFDACMAKLKQQSTKKSLQEFVDCFLSQKLSQKSLEDMRTFFECSSSERQGRLENGWTKASDWTPCAIGMSPCPYNTNGMMPNIFVPEKTSTHGEPFEKSQCMIDYDHREAVEHPTHFMDSSTGQLVTESRSMSEDDNSGGICLPPSASFFHSKNVDASPL